MLSVNGRNRVQLLLVRSTNAVLSRDIKLFTTCGPSQLLFPGKFQMCFQCTFPSGFFHCGTKDF